MAKSTSHGTSKLTRISNLNTPSKQPKPSRRKDKRPTNQQAETLEVRTLLSGVNEPSIAQIADVVAAAASEDDEVAQIQSLNYRDFHKLDRDQIVHLTADQLQSMPNRRSFRRIPNPSRAALTESQVQALDVSIVGIRKLTRDQRNQLTSDQIQDVIIREFRFLSADQIPSLSSQQIGSIPNSMWWRRIPSNLRNAMSTEQIQALNVQRIRLHRLTESQQDSLSVTQIQSLHFREFRHLDPEQVVHLREAQLRRIPNDWWFNQMRSGARAALSDAQVQCLRVNNTVACLNSLVHLL